MRNVSISVFLLGTLISGTAFAASSNDPGIAVLRNQSGKILVNTGHGFSVAAAATRLNPGDTIMVGTNATASLYFVEAKCSATLPSSSVTTVIGPEMCQQATLPQATEAPVISPANSGPRPQGEIPPLFIAGGIVVLSAAALIDGFSQKNSSPAPVSSP